MCAFEEFKMWNFKVIIFLLTGKRFNEVNKESRNSSNLIWVSFPANYDFGIG
jgi:hypothetical protein